MSESDRIFISRDGQLYFAHLLSEDNDQSIACSAVSSEQMAGNYGPFFKVSTSTPNNSSLSRKMFSIGLIADDRRGGH